MYFLKIEIINIYDYVNLLFGVKYWIIMNVNLLRCDDVVCENVYNLFKLVVEMEREIIMLNLVNN